ncbi:MAG: TonB-dependent receptor [Candidatus Korobacteraceae bacterium]
MRRIMMATLLLLPLGLYVPLQIMAQSTGSLQGAVSILPDGGRIHNATVLIVQNGRNTETDDNGAFEFSGLAPGVYDVIARLPGLREARGTVTVAAGETSRLDLQLRIAPVSERVVVTASAREESAFDSFQATTTLDSFDLAQAARTSLGEALEYQPGIAKRSFGPGSSRPVLRGFDGDRVLVMKDGMPMGTLASQSGDHGDTVDVLTLDRLEVVKGPATLLYGSNALGGVVNAISLQESVDQHAHSGLTGSVTGTGGSNNGQGGGGTAIQYGSGNWMVWGTGGGQRTGNYQTPAGEVANSKTRLATGSGGFGRYGQKAFAAFNLGYENSRYGIPPAEEDEVVDLALRRYNPRLTLGLRDLNGFLNSALFKLDFSGYSHKELEITDEGEEVGTSFQNRQFNYRTVFTQNTAGRLSGSFGFSGMHRNYDVTGAEALSPPVDQNNFAVFGLQQVDLRRLRLQFGGRVETNRYSPVGAPGRDFTGFSGSAGVHVPLWEGGAFVANYTHAYRAPALEELYNNGPHIGNLTFEVGNPELSRERSDGVDFSLRHRADRERAVANFFIYQIADFVFLAPTGNIEEGLVEAEYLQGNTRYLGGEASLDVAVHPNLWLNLGMDTVNAELRSSVASSTGLVTPVGTPLPRIPPLRARAGLDIRYRGLSVRPQIIAASDQSSVFVTETRTPGYTIANLAASYTVVGRHATHVISMTAFNLGDRLYLNHLSLIKNLAPEMGRGVRFGYTVRFF